MKKTEIVLNAFRINILPTLALIFTLSQIGTAQANSDTVTKEQKNQIKEKLKIVTLESRLEALSRAEVIEKKIDKLHRQSPEKIAEIDLIKELSDICGANFKYENNNSKPNISWPTVSCKYHQAEKVVGGSTAKFLCDFNEVKKDGQKVVKTRKVKFMPFSGLKRSELVPSIVASTMSRLVGFHTESYCPALIQCENCPSSDPWTFGKARSSGSFQTYDFQDSMVEFETDLMTITPNIPRVQKDKAHGVALGEIKNVKDTESKSAREKMIEREAWLLWLNFVVEMDATDANQRLACDKASLNGDNVYCDKPVMYTHDYGQSFYRRFQFDRWKNVPPLVQNADNTCRGGMTPEVMKETGGSQTSIEVGPQISAEARDFLVSRLKNISDKQWMDIVRIANTQRLYKVAPEAFLSAIKSKIDNLAQARCASYDSGTTVLSLTK